MINTDWEERWGRTTREDFDNGNLFLINIIVHKLELMKNYYSQADSRYHRKSKALAQIRQTLNDTLELAYKIWGRPDAPSIELDSVIERYYSESSEIYEVHTIRYRVSSSNGEASAFNKRPIKIVWDNKSNEQLWKKVIKKEDRKRQRDIDAFFLMISRHHSSWCD